MAAEEVITLPIQVNGKMRGQIDVAVDISEEELRERVLNLENVKKFIPEGAQLRRFIVVPGRIVNIVVG
jgi:leucyl-tRNA synthetase